MAGPVASILVRQPLADEHIASIRDTIAEMADEIAGDDFRLNGRPFILSLGEEYKGELAELVSAQLPAVLGWIPRDTFRIAAMCNDQIDHRLLARLCLRFATMLDGIVGFGGRLLPWPSLDGPAPLAAVKIEDARALGGVLYATSYLVREGRYCTIHYGDAPFVEAWLRHPDFRLVK